MRRAWLCMAACLLLAACASLRWQKPEVSLADVSVVGGNLLDSKLALKLRVRNRNDREIALDSLSFEIVIDEQVLARGMRNTPIMLAANGETLVDLEASARTLELLKRLRDASRNAEGRIPYTVRGEALVHDYGSLPFSHVSTLALPKLPGLSSSPGPT